jgi:hypothetical protein
MPTNHHLLQTSSRRRCPRFPLKSFRIARCESHALTRVVGHRLQPPQATSTDEGVRVTDSAGSEDSMLTTPPRPARGLLVAGGFLAAICALSVADASLSQANRQPSTHTTVAQGAEVPMLDGTHQQVPLRMRASVGPRRFEVSMVTADPPPAPTACAWSAHPKGRPLCARSTCAENR